MKKPLKFHKEGEQRALIELAQAYDPKEAIRENITNSLDAQIPNQELNISVSVYPSRKRIVISDNGEGMTYEHMENLPKSIGYSIKKGSDKRGEKALGLLSFGSLGNVMQMLSRPYGTKGKNYNHLIWEIKNNKILADSVRKLNSMEVERDFYGNFPHGTNVIIDQVHPNVLKILTQSNLKNWISNLYTPALHKGIADIRVLREIKKKKLHQIMVKPIRYQKESSSKLIDDTFEISIKGEENPGSLEILLFIDPDAVFDKVGVYSKDVLVYQSLAELPEFSKSPVWTSGKVTGYINDHFNRLILGREGIDRKRNAFKSWYNSIQDLEKELIPRLEDAKTNGRKAKETNRIKKAFNVLSEVMKDIKKTELGDQYSRSEKGEIIGVKGAEPTIKRRRKKKPTIKKDPTGKGPGPGTFIQEPEGHKERVVKKSGVPFGFPQPIEFQKSESHLRSKLEDLLGKPTLYLNSSHEDYKSRVNLKDDNVFVRYVIELISKEASYYDVRKSDREGKLLGNKDEIVNNALQREEFVKFLALKRLGIK